mmetsp:Transcript_68314/g.154544  ORF Transcript_68314/g.154544 Transcript_68314/m.154544 type:complete len:92 (+) Transcript_68314:440-715(+)
MAHRAHAANRILHTGTGTIGGTFRTKKETFSISMSQETVRTMLKVNTKVKMASHFGNFNSFIKKSIILLKKGLMTPAKAARNGRRADPMVT